MKHFKHRHYVSVNKMYDVKACTGMIPKLSEVDTVWSDIDEVECRECFFIYHHPNINCCGGRGPYGSH